MTRRAAPRGSVWAVVPLKQTTQAKQRLSALLDARERAELMLAMARDVLTALARCAEIAGTLVVSRGEPAAALAAELRIEVLRESSNAGLSDAVYEGCAWVEQERRATSVLVVPGDVPLIECEDVSVLLAAHETVTLVPASDGDGTNCILATPPTRLPFHFGRASFDRHARVARDLGIEPRLAANLHLGLDIDTPDDLRALIGRNGAPHTRTYLDASGIASRIGRPHNSPSSRVRT